MKLSEAIEHCLVSGAYVACGRYMCLALERVKEDYHVDSVRAMMEKIDKREDRFNSSLVGVLFWNQILSADLTNHAVDKYTTELYVWWVFDLKRKGL